MLVMLGDKKEEKRHFGEREREKSRVRKLGSMQAALLSATEAKEKEAEGETSLSSGFIQSISPLATKGLFLPFLISLSPSLEVRKGSFAFSCCAPYLSVRFSLTSCLF